MRSVVTAPALPSSNSPLLRAYLLGTLEFDAVVRLQRSLAFQLSEVDAGGALLLCEHPPLITVGRHGSPGDISLTPDELAARQWPVRWVPRGGGCFLHLPGQLALYPLMNLERLGLDVPAYLRRLQEVLIALLDDFGIHASYRPDQAGVHVGGRLLAALGIGVRGGISLFGAVINLDPDLTLFRLVHTGAPGDGPMTSLARERKGPLRTALVRQRLLEHFARVFGFERTELFFAPPGQPDHTRLVAPSSGAGK
jgi:lipoyl(octanoyl) transferase